MCEKIYIPFPQLVDISGLELQLSKDIFVNRLFVLNPGIKIIIHYIN